MIEIFRFKSERYFNDDTGCNYLSLRVHYGKVAFFFDMGGEDYVCNPYSRSITNFKSYNARENL